VKPRDRLLEQLFEEERQASQVLLDDRNAEAYTMSTKNAGA
jgi:hypothetical protein